MRENRGAREQKGGLHERQHDPAWRGLAKRPKQAARPQFAVGRKGPLTTVRNDPRRVLGQRKRPRTAVAGVCDRHHCKWGKRRAVFPKFRRAVGVFVMLYRWPSQLALGAAALLALEPEGASRRVRDLAAALGVQAAYLAKILQGLTRVGLLRAVRGPGGGVQLSHSAGEIHPWDVLCAVESPDKFTRCFLGQRQCDEENPCPLHEVWAPARRRILEILQTKTLREFAEEARAKGALSWEATVSGGSAVNRLFSPENRPVT